MSYVGDDLLLFLFCVPGVYVPPGAGIGVGGIGTRTGFFPGNRASNDCLDGLNKNNPEHSYNKNSLFIISSGIIMKGFTKTKQWYEKKLNVNLKLN